MRISKQYYQENTDDPKQVKTNIKQQQQKHKYPLSKQLLTSKRIIP